MKNQMKNRFDNRSGLIALLLCTLATGFHWESIDTSFSASIGAVRSTFRSFDLASEATGTASSRPQRVAAAPATPPAAPAQRPVTLVGGPPAAAPAAPAAELAQPKELKQENYCDGKILFRLRLVESEKEGKVITTIQAFERFPKGYSAETLRESRELVGTIQDNTASDDGLAKLIKSFEETFTAKWCPKAQASTPAAAKGSSEAARSSDDEELTEDEKEKRRDDVRHCRTDVHGDSLEAEQVLACHVSNLKGDRELKRKDADEAVKDDFDVVMKKLEELVNVNCDYVAAPATESGRTRSALANSECLKKARESLRDARRLAERAKSNLKSSRLSERNTMIGKLQAMLNKGDVELHFTEEKMNIGDQELQLRTVYKAYQLYQTLCDRTGRASVCSLRDSAVSDYNQNFAELRLTQARVENDFAYANEMQRIRADFNRQFISAADYMDTLKPAELDRTVLRKMLLDPTYLRAGSSQIPGLAMPSAPTLSAEVRRDLGYPESEPGSQPNPALREQLASPVVPGGVPSRRVYSAYPTGPTSGGTLPVGQQNPFSASSQGNSGSETNPFLNSPGTQGIPGGNQFGLNYGRVYPSSGIWGPGQG